MKDEIKGKIDEQKGKLTGDKSDEIKGKAEQAMDKVKRTGRDISGDINEKKDDVESDADREREAETAREKRSW